MLFLSCFEQIKDVADAGLTVSFLQEKMPGFYATKDVEISFPVLPCEVAVLEHPTAETKNRKYGFEFDGGLKQELITYFKKDTD